MDGRQRADTLLKALTGLLEEQRQQITDLKAIGSSQYEKIQKHEKIVAGHKGTTTQREHTILELESKLSDLQKDHRVCGKLHTILQLQSH